jgi:hypothetical protein
MDVVQKIEKLETNSADRPVKSVEISDSGTIDVDGDIMITV